jgi:tyrosyl-tRNA synthetase
MSKSLGNYVALNDSPAEIFGKLMSISDELMVRYYLLLLSRVLPKNKHPLEAKKELAAEIIATYHSRAAANKAQEEWTRRFSEKRLSETELPILASQSNEVVTIVVKGFAVHGITKSRAEASRLIKQGSIQLDGAKLRNPTEQITLSANQVLRLDKTHAVRIA